MPLYHIEKRWNLYFDYVNAPQNGMPLLSISYKSSVLSPLLNRQSKSPNVILVHVFFFNDKGKMGGNVCGNNVAASCGVSATREACGSQAAFLSLFPCSNSSCYAVHLPAHSVLLSLLGSCSSSAYVRSLLYSGATQTVYPALVGKAVTFLIK